MQPNEPNGGSRDLGAGAVCPTCTQKNRAGASFCMHCGAPLADRCTSCGRELPPRAAYCDGCGRSVDPGPTAADLRSYTPRHLSDTILRSRSAMEGERKQVTVLFADIRGSMELAAQVDAEEWHGILDRFFQIGSDAVHRFEGTVNQYTGDGIMALFGAPIAHEDHAQRACYAALQLGRDLRSYAHRLRRERSLDLTIRQGLHSGEVVVGRIGDDLRMDYTAQGQTVGLAARLQQIAEAGSIYLSQATAALITGFFELEDLGEFQLKGVDGPVPVRALVGPGQLRTRLDSSRSRGFSRFVGRHEEMAALEAALEKAGQGQGRVVGVVGEAGSGKSRLCWELGERCRARSMRWLEGRALSHGGSIPYLPVRELVRGALGIGDEDSKAAARQKAAGALALLDARLETALPPVLELLGIGGDGVAPPSGDPETLRRELFATLSRLLLEGNDAAPTVLLVEDLHWIDDVSAAFLDSLVEMVERWPVLLLVNYRPEVRPAWAARSWYQQVPLRPLESAAAAELLRELLGDHPSIEPLHELILDRTGGNPFFIEEVVRHLADSSVLRGDRGAFELAGAADAIAIPSSVQTTLAARIDRLPEREKHLLQTAAVIGRRIGEDLLAAVLDLADGERRAAVDRLVDSELLEEIALYPMAEYEFRHPLTQQVAYSSQLSQPRARIHRRVARALETLRSERLEEQAPLLAFHWEEAGEARQAARWHLRAAEPASFRDIPRALHHWQRVRTLAGALPDDEESLSLRLRACWNVIDIGGRAGTLSTGEAEAIFEQGRRLAEECGDRTAQVHLHTALAARIGWSGDLERQRLLLEAAEGFAEPPFDLQASLTLLQRSFVAQFHYGDMRRALELAEKGIGLVDGDPAFSRLTGSLQTRNGLLASKATALSQMGRLQEAESLLTEVLDATGSSSHGRWTRALHTPALIRANLSFYRGDEVASLHDAIAFVELAESSGSVWARPVSSLALGRAHLLGERWDEACEWIERSLSQAREHRFGLEAEAIHLAALAEAQLGAGRQRRALETAEQAVRIAEDKKTRFWGLMAQLALLAVQLAGGVADESIGSGLQRADDLLEWTGGELLRPILSLRRAAFAGRRGDVVEQTSQLRDAHVAFESMTARGHAARIARRLTRGDC